jgi:3-methyl-2-oxobutanoate hydroxymethyltransferase
MSEKKQKKITTQSFIKMKENGEKITILTSYDYIMAKALDSAGVDALLVGDSMGMVIYGQDSTLPVTVEDILRHTQAVKRGAKRSMVIADMPFMSFSTPEIALNNAGRFIKEGNADAVKLEGGRERVKSIKMMIECGIPVMGHIGLTPQYVHQLGGYKLQGKNAHAAERLIEDALILEEAGVFAIVLEMVPWQVAKEISSRIKIPTIGIGAGAHCDGQVLVAQDMMGFSDGKPFKFVKKYADVWNTMVNAGKEYINDIKNGQFPAQENSFEIPEDEFLMLKDSIDNNPKIKKFVNQKGIINKKDKETDIGSIYSN